MKSLLDSIWETEENDVVEIQMVIACIVISCGGTNPPPPPPPPDPSSRYAPCAVPY
jgi:hypothetical protein